MAEYAIVKVRNLWSLREKSPSGRYSNGLKWSKNIEPLKAYAEEHGMNVTEITETESQEPTRQKALLLRHVIHYLSTDAFYITVGKKGVDKTEYIESSAKNSFRELKKYFDYSVSEIIPDAGYVEIILKKQL